MVEACATGEEPPIRLVLEEGVATVSGDATRLSQVVVNLLDNAREAAAAPPAPAGGEPAGPARPVEVRTEAGEEGGVQICVLDSGPGIAGITHPMKPTTTSADPRIDIRIDRTICEPPRERYGMSGGQPPTLQNWYSMRAGSRGSTRAR